MFLVIACNEMVMSNLTVKEVRGWEDLGSLGEGAIYNMKAAAGYSILWVAPILWVIMEP